MVRGLGLLLVVVAGVVESAPVRVVVLPFTANDPSVRSLASAAEEQVLTELASGKTLSPLGPADVAAMLGVERQRQLMGCAEAGDSCAAELGGALGTRWLITGVVSSAGNRQRIDLKLLDSNKGAAALREGRTFDRNALFDVVPELAASLRRFIEVETGVNAVEKPVRVAPWLVAGAGAVVAGVGGGLLGWASADVDGLRRRLAMTSYTDANAQLQSANLRGGLGLGLLIAGVVTIGAGLLWALVFE